MNKMNANNAPSVYLCGPITGLSYDGATDWRKYVETLFAQKDIVSYSPLRNKDYLLMEKSIADSYDKYTLSTAKAITRKDRLDVTRCDLIFVNFLGAETPSLGSVLEIGWASMLGKPIVMVMEADNVHSHAMIRETVDFILPSLEEAVRIASVLLLPHS